MVATGQIFVKRVLSILLSDFILAANFFVNVAELIMKELCILMVLVINLTFIDTCSPPRSRFGDFSLKKLSLVKRAQQADMVVVGTVIGVFHDRFRSSVKAKIAVHIQLKGNHTLSNVIEVFGFGKDTEKFGAFYTSAHLDCTDTNVALYGSYIFFLKVNRHKLYHVQELGYQSAVTEISCEKQFSSKIQRVFSEFRTQNLKELRCYDSKNDRTYRGTKCTREKVLTKLLYEFTYGLINPRTIYCSLQGKRYLKSLPTRTTFSNNKLRDEAILKLSTYSTTNIEYKKSERKNETPMAPRQAIGRYSVKTDVLVTQMKKLVVPEDLQKLSLER